MEKTTSSLLSLDEALNGVFYHYEQIGGGTKKSTHCDGLL